MSKRILFFILFSWLASAAFPAFAQQKTDTVYTFRFVTQKDMFYVPWNGNDTELARLLECIENNKATILDGKLPLLVDGYCNSQSSEAENLATAKIRANRVKSELITRAEIKEENFITRNHATEGDFVTVRDGTGKGNSRDGCGSGSTTQGGSRTTGSREACRAGTACRRATQGGRSPTCR